MRFPVLNEVEAYWEALRDGRIAPARAEVDPRGLQRALSNAFILERVAPGVLRFRVAGQHLSALMGMETRGMPLSAFLTPEARPEMASLADALFDTPQSLRLTIASARGIGRPALTAEILLLPLGDDRGVLNRALGCLASAGGVGRSPRRFRIASAHAMPLTGIDTRSVSDWRDEAAPQRGFAEVPPPFSAAPDRTRQKAPSGNRPSLRLVTSRD